MGFFQDLKDDLSQAVDEMLPDEKEAEVNDEPMTLESHEPVATEEETIEEEILQEEESVETEETLEEEEEEEEVVVSSVKEESKFGGSRIMEEFSDEVLDETAVITAGMSITGDIKSQGSLDVIGSVVGNIDILGKLNISGNIQGDSKAAEVFADSAKIVGEVHSSGSIKIGQSSVVIGNIVATSAVIAGAVKGDIDVKGPVVLDSSAIVMGNIKSKSVQINNGAVIEGMCSQCYAEVNPTAFFSEYKK